jgi:hypothetical protein
MQKEIIDKENPHKDIGKQKFRVKRLFTAWVEYDVVADTEQEAWEAVAEHGGIDKIEWSEGYHKDEPVEVYAGDWNITYDDDGDEVKKIAECVPYEDNSTVDYSDPNWTTNEFEWLDQDYVNPNKEDKKDDMEVPF